MKKEYPSLEELRSRFGNNKIIPQRYEEIILQALSHYPELITTRIQFKLKNKHPVPYGTSPAPGSVFLSADRRSYVVSILESADLPVKLALFKNLPPDAQRAVIGHELGHVLQYQASGTLQLLKVAAGYANLFSRRKLEREADIAAIEHGLGHDLYVHAVYIRKIPGYIEKRKNIDTDYLKPHEILGALPAIFPAV